MKRGNAFTKRYLNVCLAQEIKCNIWKYKGHFGTLCKSKGWKSVVNKVEDNVNNQNCPFSPRESQGNSEENFCGIINAWTEEGKNENNDYSVLNIRIIYNDNSLGTKELVNIELGEDAIVNMNVPVDSASPIGFLKQSVLYELNTRDPQLKNLPVEKTPANDLQLQQQYIKYDRKNCCQNTIQRMNFIRKSNFHHYRTRTEHLRKWQLTLNRNRKCAETTITPNEHRIFSGIL